VHGQFGRGRARIGDLVLLGCCRARVGPLIVATGCLTGEYSQVYLFFFLRQQRLTGQIHSLADPIWIRQDGWTSLAACTFKERRDRHT
jgi:hypothetical protein